MPSKDEWQSRATQLNNEVKAKMADLGEGKITSAEFKSFMDAAESENTEIEVGMKNWDRAMAFRAGGELNDNPGNPPAAAPVVEDARFLRGKSVMEALQGAQKAASSHQRGSFKFEVGLKTQGVAGLQGISASGTSAGDGLDAGDYFLEGAAGPSIAPQFIPGIGELAFYQNVVAGLFPTMPVVTPVVTYVMENGWTNNTAATLEGLTKPTSTNSVVRATEQIGKIANLARVTDELIQDAPAFWSLIQNRVSQGVSRQEEIELLAGDGYPGVNGLLGRNGFFTQAAAGSPTSVTIGGATGAYGTSASVSLTAGRVIQLGTSTVLDAGGEIAEGILDALTDLRVGTFYEPDTILMNPNDFQTVRVSKDQNGQYLGGSFFGSNYGQGQNAPVSGAVESGLSLWSKRVVTTPACPEGWVLVGAFRDAGSVLRKGGLSVDLTNTNGTDFEQNLWTVRAEERVGLLIDRPSLFELIQILPEGS